ncbi:unnamed protein product [Discula destructiva]
MALPMAVIAHPGENVEAIKSEMAQRNTQHAHASRALSQCQNSSKALALKQRTAERRAAKAIELRESRGLTHKRMTHHKRVIPELLVLESYVDQSHNKTALGYTFETPEETIFGSNNTCALVPETTIGPYYVTGEQIRSNITEGQAGVPMHIEMQFLDMNTCEPATELLADIWHCNSTGVYSGIDTSEAEGGLNSTFLRGVQFADAEEGVVTFDTLFPGHYDDRVTHLHVVVQDNVTVQPNNTYTGGTALHIGQLYFDDALVKAIEATYPYSTNTINYTSWEADGWMLEEATTDYDPFVEYVQLTEDLEDGLLAWITIALDRSSNRDANLTAHAHLYDTGGVTVENSSKGLPPSNPNAS